MLKRYLQTNFFNIIFKHIFMYYQQRIRNVVSLLIMSMLCLASFAQGLQVQGIVKGQNGEPMIGCQRCSERYYNGTITGIDGDFSLSGRKSLDSLLLLTLVLRTRK